MSQYLDCDESVIMVLGLYHELGLEFCGLTFGCNLYFLFGIINLVVVTLLLDIVLG